MFGFHRRTRSLISVKDLCKYEKLDIQQEAEGSIMIFEVQDEEENTTPPQQRQLTLIYILFLAEAIMAASLSSQISLLAADSSEMGVCSSLSASYLRSILSCAYFFGSTYGLFWGWLSDRVGRKPVALFGLWGMSLCCVSMGFATSLSGCVVLRFVAGCIGSAVSTSGMAMLGDVSKGTGQKTRNAARLPLVAVCGSVGPLLQSMVAKLGEGRLEGVWQRWPALSGQIACGSLVLFLAAMEAICIRETLPTASTASATIDHDDSEKGALLAYSSEDTSGVLSISVTETDSTDDLSTPAPIGITQLLRAPSLIALLVSFSLLSLHTSTLSLLLPHLGQTSTRHGGMGLPCTWLSPVLLAFKAIAAGAIFYWTPVLAAKTDVLRLYRRISLTFPLLYILIPISALLLPATALINGLAVFSKDLLAASSDVLILLLALSAAPAANSSGTVLGLVALANLFRALAVGVAGLAYYLSAEYELGVVDTALWALLAGTATAGAAVAWWVRDSPRVGVDFDENCLTWKEVFDVEGGFEAEG